MSRLHPKAEPFCPARKNASHKRWEYEVYATTKHLRLPISYQPHIKTRHSPQLTKTSTLNLSIETAKSERLHTNSKQRVSLLSQPPSIHSQRCQKLIKPKTSRTIIVKAFYERPTPTLSSPPQAHPSRTPDSRIYSLLIAARSTSAFTE